MDAIARAFGLDKIAVKLLEMKALMMFARVFYVSAGAIVLAIITGVLFTILRQRQNAFSTASKEGAAKTSWGLCFPYPGSNRCLCYFQESGVEDAAYCEMLSALAETSETTVCLVSARLRLAPLAAKSVADVFDAFPDARWIVGGHGLGGAYAASIASQRKTPLVLHASTFVDSGTRTLHLVAEHDLVSTQSSKAPPKHVTSVEIKGGNHAGFAHYGPHKYPRKDGERTISLEEQQSQVIKATADWIKSI